MEHTAPPTTIIPQWKPLRLFNLYRIAIGILLLALGLFRGAELVGQYNSLSFNWLTIGYLLFALCWTVPNQYQWPDFKLQVVIQTLADILFITLAIHFSGGIESGLGILMIAAIAGASLLMPGPAAILFATLGALTLFAEQIYSQLYHLFESTAYSQTGLLGASLFATAMLAMYLAHRAVLSEELAAQRGIDLANLAKLNEYIVNRMSSGIIVVDDDACIRLINQSVWSLLRRPPISEPKSLQDLSSPLYHLFNEWRERKPRSRSSQLLNQTSIAGLQVRITHVGTRKEDRGTVIFLQDTADINRQIQETKLASLGRLTASIAHEIRNPLGAISHAVQLLGETPGLDDADQRMVRIIHDQSRRMNEIIQNILQLSRAELPKQEPLILKEWLVSFTDEFSRVQNLPTDWASITIQPEDTVVHIDPNNFHQIMWNLCINAKKYGTQPDEAVRVDLRGGVSRDFRIPYLDVIDHGPGIDSSIQAQLFEPFFTTSTSGTGLGLYISTELLKNNGGNLSYSRDQSGGSCFRIEFPISQTEGQNIAIRANC